MICTDLIKFSNVGYQLGCELPIKQSKNENVSYEIVVVV